MPDQPKLVAHDVKSTSKPAAAGAATTSAALANSNRAPVYYSDSMDPWIGGVSSDWYAPDTPTTAAPWAKQAVPVASAAALKPTPASSVNTTAHSTSGQRPPSYVGAAYDDIDDMFCVGGFTASPYYAFTTAAPPPSATTGKHAPVSAATSAGATLARSTGAHGMGVSASHATSVPSQQASEWACPACTCFNAMSNSRCEACDGPRGVLTGKKPSFRNCPALSVIASPTTGTGAGTSTNSAAGDKGRSSGKGEGGSKPLVRHVSNSLLVGASGDGEDGVYGVYPYAQPEPAITASTSNPTPVPSSGSGSSGVSGSRVASAAHMPSHSTLSGDWLGMFDELECMDSAVTGGSSRSAGVKPVSATAATTKRTTTTTAAPRFTASATPQSAGHIGSGTAASTSRPAASQPAAPSVFAILDDYVSSREDEDAATQLYDNIVAACRVDSNPRWSDPAFTPSRASLSGCGIDASAEADVYVCLVSSDGARRTQVRVPVVWRRPQDIADEEGLYCPEAVDPAPRMLVAYVATHAHQEPTGTGTGPHSSTGSGGGIGQRGRPALLRASSCGDNDSFEGFPLSQLRTLVEYTGDEVNTGGPSWTFRSSPFSCGDVHQGSLGTCWFVSAMTVIAERRDIIQRIFRRRGLGEALLSTRTPLLPLGGSCSGTYTHTQLVAAEDQVADAQCVPVNPYGIYQLRLCIDGLWRIVTIDDHIPVNVLTGAVAYTSGLRRQIWPALLEKAASKLVGSYAGMAAGTVAEGLRLLTGASTEQVFIRTNETGVERRERQNRAWRRRHFSSDSHPSLPGDDKAWEYDFSRRAPASVVTALWNRLRGYFAEGFPMGASCSSLKLGDLIREDEVLSPPERVAAERRAREAIATREADLRSCGIIHDHAYSLLDVHEAGALRLIRLRNPWSHGRSRDGVASTWTGPWSDESVCWDGVPGLKDDLGAFVQEESGVFWMCVEDFCSYFTRLDVAKVRNRESGWTTVRVALPLYNSSDECVHVVRVRAFDVAASLEIELNQQPASCAATGGAGTASGTRAAPPFTTTGTYTTTGSGSGSSGVSATPVPSSPWLASAAAPRYVRDANAYRLDLGVAVVEELSTRPPPQRRTSAQAALGFLPPDADFEERASESCDPGFIYSACGMRYAGGCVRRRAASVVCEAPVAANGECFIAPLSFLKYNDLEARTGVIRSPVGVTGLGATGHSAGGGGGLVYGSGRSSVDDSLDWMMAGSSGTATASAGATRAAGLAVPSGSEFAVFAIHSSQPVVIDVVTKPLSWLSRAAVCQTMALGKRVSFSTEAEAAGVCLYSLTDGDGARWVHLNNHDTNTITYKTEYRGMRGLATTRGVPVEDKYDRFESSEASDSASGGAPDFAGVFDIELKDILLPRTAQLSCVMVPIASPLAQRSWETHFHVAFGGATGSGSSHYPPVAPSGLHAAFPFHSLS